MIADGLGRVVTFGDGAKKLLGFVARFLAVSAPR
jgi:hypothetical protein